MIPNVNITVAGTFDVLTLYEAKAHLRVSHTADDAEIPELVKAAVLDWETLTGMILRSSSVEESFSVFSDPIILSRWPVTAVGAVKHRGTAGITTVSSGDYVVELVGKWPRIFSAFGASWPSDTPQSGFPVRVEYTCGYANAAAIPSIVKSAIKLRLADLYENRQAVSTTGVVIPREMPLGFSHLVNIWKRGDA